MRHPHRRLLTLTTAFFSSVLFAGPLSAQTDSTCTQGRVADRRGHCCWPGQRYSQHRRACVGQAQCPAGLNNVDNECVAPSASLSTVSSGCPVGQAITADTAGHCCWPAQVWSNTRSACVGDPECPSTMRRVADQCVAPPPAPIEACRQGQIRGEDTAGHCCWPAQVWSNARSACVGDPECPSTMRRVADQCVPLPSTSADACEPGRVRGADTAGHCCWPDQVWSATRGACVGTPRCEAGFILDGNACEPVSPGSTSPLAPTPQVPQQLQLPTSLLIDYRAGNWVSLNFRFLHRIVTLGPGALAFSWEIGVGAILPPPSGAFSIGLPLAATAAYVLPIGAHLLSPHLGLGALLNITHVSVFGSNSTSVDLGLSFRVGAMFVVAVGGRPRIPLGFDLDVGGGGAVGYRFVAGVSF